MHPKQQNNNSLLAASTEEIQDLLETLLSKAKAQGASDASVHVSQQQGLSIDVRMREVESATFGEENNISLTLYYGQRKGSASSTDRSAEALDKMVAAAADIAKHSAEDPCFGLADQALLTNQFQPIDLYHEWEIKPEQAIELALACEEKALAEDARIVNSDGASVSTSASHYGYANSRGAMGFVHSTYHSISCSLIAKAGEQMQRDYDYSTARKADLLKSIDEIAHTAAERTIRRLGARKIKTQKAAVVFSNRVSPGLFGSLIGALSGSNLYQGNSFLVDSLGKSIFPEFIQVYEQPHLDLGLSSAAFDSEGVPTRNNHFIRDGRVEQYVLGSYTARRLGLQTTANSDGVHNLTIDANVPDLEAILQQMGTGLLVTELMGQGVNILTGDYSRGVSGFWVENGEIQYPVEEITIAGNLRAMFQQIALIGADTNPSSSIHCGSVLIAEMMVAGS